MKIIHIESGLGNQMLDYCDYLAVKKSNPLHKCYIETITYDIEECGEVICQWNGYELKHIFGVDAPNIAELFDEETWKQIISDIRRTRYWEKKWNWPVYYTEVLNNYGLKLHNNCGNRETESIEVPSIIKKILRNSRLAPFFKDLKNRVRINSMSKSFIPIDSDSLEGHTLAYMFKGGGIELISDEVRKTFSFPAFTDPANIEEAKKINSCEAVSIHVRRGDFLPTNEQYFESGYFKRAVRLIKRKVSEPVFYIFTDSQSEGWVKDNLDILGLDKRVDQIIYVNWNHGEYAYRDMQLMTLCKHNIIGYSSFGWWGSYLNTNPCKITISPEPKILTTNYC